MTCAVCGKKAVYRFSPDLDIRGIGACKRHKARVQMAYIGLITGGEELYHNLLGV